MSKKQRLEFDDQLRQAIEHCGMSRYEISQQSGVDQAVLSRFMSGKAGMSMDSINLIFRLLDLEINTPACKRVKR